MRAFLGEERSDGARKRKHSPIPLFKPRERQPARDAKEKDAKGAAPEKVPAERVDAVEPAAKRPAPANNQARSAVENWGAVADCASLLNGMHAGLSYAAPAFPHDIDT